MTTFMMISKDGQARRRRTLPVCRDAEPEISLQLTSLAAVRTLLGVPGAKRKVRD